MAQQYSSYPIDRIQSSPSTSSKPSTRSASTKLTTSKQSTHKYGMRSSSNTVPYKGYQSPSNTPNIPTNSNYNYPSLTTKPDPTKYLRGIVMVTPQNEATPGWIYCKTRNAMYELPFNDKKHYICDQIVLFNVTNKLRGLKLSEARCLMGSHKFCINNFNNYFVSDSSCCNIHYTTLIGLDEINKKYLTINSESINCSDKFILNTFINLRENQEIEFKLLDTKKDDLFSFSKMVNILERYLNGFVNMSGGTIYCGINDDGRIIGENIYNINEIEIKICDKLREWNPKQYTQKLIQSISIDIIDIIKIDDEENVGFILPNKKVIKANIKTVKDINGNNVVFTSSKMNRNVVYVRHLSSLCAYTDCTMHQQIGKRQIHKLNENEAQSDIDFDDDDEKDWIQIHSDKLKYDNNNNDKYYYFNKRITNIFKNIQNSFKT